jgi:hypothetical protein
MTNPDLVLPVHHDDHRRTPLDAPPEEPQQVERAVIGPLRVVEHDQGGRVPQFVEEQLPDLDRIAGEPHVPQRPERHRRRERFARAAQQTAGDLAAERVDQRRLARARVAGHQHQAAVSGDSLLPPRGQCGTLAVALHQRGCAHPPIVGSPRAE